MGEVCGQSFVNKTVDKASTARKANSVDNVDVRAVRYINTTHKLLSFTRFYIITHSFLVDL